MSSETAGLSIQDAFRLAEAEETVTAEPSEEPVSLPAEEEGVSDEEQSAVESDQEPGLFGELVEKKEPSEQPVDLDSQLVPVTIDGETMMITVEEARLGYQRQQDYTKGRQETSALRKEAESALALYEALQKNPKQTLQRLWDSLRSGDPLVPTPDKEMVEVSANAVDIDALVTQKLNEVLANDPRLRALEEQRAVDEINGIFDELELVYEVKISEADRIFVLEKAQEAGTTDIGLVFGGLMQQRSVRDKQRTNAVANSSATGYGGHQAFGSAPPTTKKFGSFREAMNDTFAAEGIDAKALEAAVSNL